MSLYAWTTPAFIPGSPVDHTWVTSYDSRTNGFQSVADVVAAGEHYWYCWGNFHMQGIPIDPIVSGAPSSQAAACLVVPDAPKLHGTIYWYGLDGVCHQVSNQVLYVTSSATGGNPRIVNKARGYKLSSALYGIYGRREAEWDEIRQRCGVAPLSIQSRRGRISVISRRMASILSFSIGDVRVLRMEESRRQLLADLDEIGFATRTTSETVESRVAKLNQRINSFLRNASNEFLTDDASFIRMFGISPDEEIYLIDPSLFQFPEPTDKPERGSDFGW